MNPYYSQDFFGFFALFLQRMFLLCTGQLSLDALTIDEVQIFTLMIKKGIVLPLVNTSQRLMYLTALKMKRRHKPTYQN